MDQLPADTLVIAETAVARSELSAALRADGLSIREIGDVVAPRRASLAFYEARELARRI
jgi:hypothetical protein